MNRIVMKELMASIAKQSPLTTFIQVALILCLLTPFSAYSQTQTISRDFSRAELDQMLAPIALYPDTVLSHILIAATYPLEVVQADRWARENQGSKGQTAVDAVDGEDWDASVKALVAFPELLQRMSNDLEWTQRLGDAFLDDEAELMDVIQDLREKAYASGSLDKMKYVRAERNNDVIIIEPTVERVVYVPYYDTRVVYGGWWWPDYPPVYWSYPHNHVYAGGFYWGPRVYLGSSFFFSSFHWHRHHLVVVSRHHPHPRFHSGRSVANYRGASHWQHNPSHRRGVAYRNDNIRRHYHSNRNSYRESHAQRNPDQHRARKVNVTNNAGNRNPPRAVHDTTRQNNKILRRTGDDNKSVDRKNRTAPSSNDASLERRRDQVERTRNRAPEDRLKRDANKVKNLNDSTERVDNKSYPRTQPSIIRRTEQPSQVHQNRRSGDVQHLRRNHQPRNQDGGRPGRTPGSVRENHSR